MHADVRTYIQIISLVIESHINYCPDKKHFGKVGSQCEQKEVRQNSFCGTCAFLSSLVFGSNYWETKHPVWRLHAHTSQGQYYLKDLWRHGGSFMGVFVRVERRLRE